MQASEFSIRKSNEIIKQVTLGLLGVFSLFLILFTINKGLVTGEVTLDTLKSAIPVGGSAQSNTSNTGSIDIVPSSGSGGSSKPCKPKDKEGVIASLSAGGLCANTSCGILNGCNWQQYDSVITSAVGGDAKLRKMTIVIMCKESRAKPTATNKNPDGSFDCGLMQINQKTPCELNPSKESQEANIIKGVETLREKIRNVSKYGIVDGVPVNGNVFASYNCCANGTVPASPSNDCKDGFPPNFPKWACPINPGEGQFNMCVVKNYACELVACMDKI